nr:MAG TPA: hypothetical protein [Microviridae sp.]
MKGSRAAPLKLVELATAASGIYIARYIISK